MKRIVLFMFHGQWDVCRSRLRLFRRFNPEIEIYGLFGGEAEDLESAQALRGEGLLDVFHLRDRSPRWKWANTDLAVRVWFAERGHQIDFDVVHLVHWDLLFFAPLDELYAGVGRDAVGLSGITPVAAIADRWAWMQHDPERTESLRLQEIARRDLGFTGTPLACLGPGYCLPRTFLERFAAIDTPEIGHDELRLPLFAELLGFDLADTGFYPRWFDAEDERLFNANGGELDPRDVSRELSRAHGRRAFHPCRESFDAAQLEALTAVHRAPPTAGPTPKVSVLMFAYNLLEYAPAALDSVLSQRAEFDWEIVVGDDCSSDGTRELLFDYQARHPDRISLVLPATRLGGGGVPLFAEVFRAARGEYLAYCDCDDFWTSPTKLARQVEILERHPECAICFHDCAVVHPDGRFDDANYTPRTIARFSTLDDLWFENFIASCSAMIRRSALPTLPEWYPRVRWGDWARYVLAARLGSIVYIDEAMGVYRARPGGEWSGLTRAQQLDSVVEFLTDLDRRLGHQYSKQLRRGIGRNLLGLAAALSKEGRPVAARQAALRGWWALRGPNLTSVPSFTALAALLKEPGSPPDELTGRTGR